MKIEISEYEKKYSFNLEKITQLCGQNVMKKTYIFESIRRYFSTYKYREEQNKWRENIKVDGEAVGRKFFEILSVSSMEDVLMTIKWSKQSLMMDYVKQLTQRFEWQTHMRVINEELEKMFQMMNLEINHLGKLELVFAMSNVWDILQKSEVVGIEQKILEEQDNYELLMIFMNLIEEVLKCNPRKMLVLIENLDHLVTREEYMCVLNKLNEITRKFDVYFVLSTSIDGYVKYDKELCSGIKIFGDVDFQMPEFDKIAEFINERYPYHKVLADEQIFNDLRMVTQKIGQSDFLYSVEESVVCKMVNKTLMLYDKWEKEEKALEIAFLKS